MDGADGPRLPRPGPARGQRVRRRLVDDRRHARQLVPGRRPGGQALRARRGSPSRRALLRGPAGRVSARRVPARERGGRDLGLGDLSHRGPPALHGARPSAPVGVLPRVQRLARRLLPGGARAPPGHRPHQRRGRRRGRPRAHAGAPARPGRRHDHGRAAEDRSYDHTMYEPFWAAAQDLDAPISLHVATNRPTPYSDAESNRTSRASLLANADYWVRVALGHLILEGVFERYPRLARRLGRARDRVGARTSSTGSTTRTRSAPGAPTGSAIAPTCCRATSSGRTSS